MPRNSSGTYSTPAGQPVVSGTTISSATHNALVSDLATEVTDSLSRSGKGGMTAPLRTPDGNASAPTHSFSSDTDSGLYAKGANNPAMAVAGSERQEWTSTGSKVTGAFEATGATTVGSLVVGAASLAAAATTSANGGVRLAAAPGSAANPVVPVVDASDDVDVATRKIVNVEDPTNAQDAATKTWTETHVGKADGTITAAANWTLSSREFLRKAGGIVTMYLYATASAGASFGQIATLPAGFRPFTNGDPNGILVPAYFFDSSTSTNFLSLAEIRDDGLVRMTRYDDGTNLALPPALGANDQVAISVTFAVA